MSGSSFMVYIGCVPGSSLIRLVTFFRVRSTRTSYPVWVTGSITLANAVRVTKGGSVSSKKEGRRTDLRGSFRVMVEK